MKKRWLFLSLCILLLCGLAACGNGETQNLPEESSDPLESVSPGPEEGMPYWSETVTEKSFKAEDNVTILTVSYVHPKMENPDLAGIAINAYYDKLLQSTLEYAETELYDIALSDYEADKESFAPYEDSQSYVLMYQDDLYISFFLEYYNFLGGARADTAYAGDTFRLDTGARVTSTEFFDGAYSEYRETLLEMIVEQAAEQAELLYENYASVIDETFHPDHFYLSDEGFVFYFPPTEIGPFASGLLTYTISYESVEDMLKEWN